MFHRVADASKVTLVALVERLRANGFLLLDTQWVTEHLQQFGAVEIPRRRYLKLLAQAIEHEASFVTR
jgi:leucyl/phenylalanyl-tRNA--protein transferase